MKSIPCKSELGVEIFRDHSGIPHIHASNLNGVAWGIGYCHALDRGMQLLLMRILGLGQLSEHLDSSDESLEIDKFFRRMGWHCDLDHQWSLVEKEVAEYTEHYCNGVNQRLKEKVPWELRLMGYKPKPVTVQEVLLISRMSGYLTLAQSQGEVERFFVELVQGGVSSERLIALFSNIEDVASLSEDRDGYATREQLEKVQLGERLVPESLKWNSPIPRMMASNNWVTSGSMNASGKPMLANDPHLEINRLPNVWYELAVKNEAAEDYAICASFVGLPLPLIGRTRSLSWGATYAFMDAIDSWIEDCRDGQCRRGDTWVDFEERTETIQRKGKDEETFTYYYNEHGVLDGDPRKPGLYLATRWSAGDSGAHSLNGFYKLWAARSVSEGMRAVQQVESAFNWVFADAKGNIGYQMSGLMPKRRAGVSGFVPLPGWLPQNDWQGFEDAKDLPQSVNPECGYIATANQDLNHLGKVSPINMPMGMYRADRIAELLEGKSDLAIQDHLDIQTDLFSNQADSFLKVLLPLLPDTERVRELKAWDRCYRTDSREATFFEGFYAELRALLFAPESIGAEVMQHLASQTGIFIDFYANFDALMMAESSPWHTERGRESLFREAYAAAEIHPRREWGKLNQFTMTNILFGGKLPRILGFDRGPYALPGGRATVHQGQVYRAAGRQTSFAPSVRVVVDMADDKLHSSLVGGPSDRRFSKWYCSDFEGWRSHKLKTTSAV
jgi:penicillin amidase